VAARARVSARVFLAGRWSAVRETPGSSDAGEASLILFPVRRVSEVTATLDVRPHDNISVRLEYRHDGASAPLYFRGTVAGRGEPEDPFIANATSQQTLTFGVVGWF
jgi:hypothetical protein